MKILTSKLSQWFFFKYFNIPKGKEIFAIGRNFIDYWEDKEKGIAKRHDYGQPLMRINPWVGLLSEPERGSTDTASTNNKDSHISANNTTTNYGTDTTMYFGAWNGHVRRALIHFTLSSGSGTISDIKLYLNHYSSYQVDNDIHELTETAWVEDEVTWARASDATDWDDGGEYSATVIDTVTSPSSGWAAYILKGTGATNPISKSWGDELHLLLKGTSEGAGTISGSVYTKENATNKPYIEITYSVEGWANISHVKGIAAASISHKKGVAVADISHVKGVAV